jgi:hypothetical protein
VGRWSRRHRQLVKRIAAKFTDRKELGAGVTFAVLVKPNATYTATYSAVDTPLRRWSIDGL